LSSSGGSKTFLKGRNGFDTDQGLGCILAFSHGSLNYKNVFRNEEYLVTTDD
jgi:hypothetical protein